MRVTVRNILKDAMHQLNKNKIQDSSIIVREILCYVLKEKKQFLIINQDKELDKKTIENFYKYIDEIIKGKPLQYINNKQEFMGYEFFVDENVLIPQPDTETVVEKVIDIYKERLSKLENVRILDLCTGSGAIAISIDKQLEKNNNLKIDASDISKVALQVAQKNKNNLKSDVNFINSNMFNNIKEKYDIIVSNPPYIEKNIIKTLPKDVQKEPVIALDGGNDGLDYYKIISNNAYKFLNSGGYICLEIGYNQKDSVINILSLTKKYYEINAYKDLTGNYRCIMAKMIN